MESELWPRKLHECGRANVPVIVVNARVSDRSFARGLKVRVVWGRVLQRVSLWLAQSEEDARRLIAMGGRTESVRAIGNLKYDVRAPKESRVTELIREVAAGRPIVVAGSTVGGAGGGRDEERSILATQQECFPGSGSVRPLLVLAPRHPERFPVAEAILSNYKYVRVSDWRGNCEPSLAEIVLLDTIGDLAAVYGIGDVAFVGGSLVKRGGHNPLEPAQFSVPVVMGSSFENFRDITRRMMEAKAIRVVDDEDDLHETLINFLSDGEAARAMGERGRKVFEEQQGATTRAVEAIVAMIHTGAKP
jgi:3-deoxy-D-manno-octulosonic-acid transferase